MKHRSAVLMVAGVLLALAAYAYWVYLGRDWRVQIPPEAMHFSAAVRTGRGGAGQILELSFDNRAQYGIIVLENSALGGPFEAELTEEATGRTFRMLPCPEEPPELHVVRSNSRCSWTVQLQRLYGSLPPGRYRLRLVYDTEGRDDWPEDVDAGRFETEARFEVTSPKLPPEQPE